MPTLRYPVLVWEDFGGFFTASAVGAPRRPERAVAVGRSADEALSAVREYLTWCARRGGLGGGPDFLDAELLTISVKVRPAHREGFRVFPSERLVTVRVPCVWGRRSGGLLTCALPTFGTDFHFYEERELKPLVCDRVQERLKGLNPREISRYMPPKAAFLSEVAVRSPGRHRAAPSGPLSAVLAAVATPLADRASRRSFSRAFEREREVADLVRRLGEEKANVLLVGESDVGKTTVLVEAVRKLEGAGGSGDSTGAPGVRRFWLTNGSRLIAGMKYLGQWQERCERVIEELSGPDGVLCIENLLDVVRVGGEGPEDSLAAFFLPYVRSGELRLVAEATPGELDACRRLLPGFADVFQILELPEFDRERAVRCLASVARLHGERTRVRLGRGAVELVYHVFRRFVPYAAFPGRAAAFIAEAFERAARDPLKSRDGEASVGADEVIRLFVRQTGLPEAFLRDEVPLRKADVRDFFAERVMGQGGPCEAAADLVITFKAGLNDPERPVGVLLFTGPTGVGKTELAKAVCDYFFGHGEESDRLVRLDMSEYAGRDAAERLLGSAGGAPGGAEPGELVRRLRRQPFSVILLDEIEKAAPEVFDVLLSVFDEGRLVDDLGRVTVFRSAVVVMTSNLGAEKRESMGFGADSNGAGGPDYAAEVMSFFRPEFFNRLDAVVTFEPLAEETVRAITRKELSEVASRDGLARAEIRLSWSEDVVGLLAREGFDRRYGARPLQRAIERLVVMPLARHLVEHPEVRDAEVRLGVGPDGTIDFAVGRIPGPPRAGGDP